MLFTPIFIMNHLNAAFPTTGQEILGVTLGCRIPKEYFETSGKGESDIAIHAGSYHLALKDANIEKYNIMTYSSILPGIARLIPQPNHMLH
jgi:arginine decarboxylase